MIEYKPTSPYTSFEDELIALRKDHRDGALPTSAYQKAVNDVLMRKQLAKAAVQIPSYWYSKYQLKDVPGNWMNPHFVHVWDISGEDKRDVTRMAIGTIYETSIYKKIVKFNETKAALEKYDVYLPIDASDLLHGGDKAMKVAIAGIMDMFTPTGLYPKPGIG